VNKTLSKTLLVTCDTVFLQPALKKWVSSSQNSLIFTPKKSNKIEKKFGGNIQALTFALPFKKRGGSSSRAKRRKSQKIFESWETIALYSGSHRGKNNKVSQANNIRFDTLIFS
jgi:hypothetical protein